ncbi:MAG: hypothetical protein WA823_02730 [Candidatus Acidiferrales bacterium]
MRSIRPTIGGFVVALILATAPVRAQQQQQQPGQQPEPDTQQGQDQNQNQNQENPTEPIPAIRSPLAGAADNGQTNIDQDAIQPDTNSITGVERVGIGAPAMTHNYWAPRLAIAGTADSNPNYEVGSSDWAGWFSILGGVDLHRSSGGSDLLLYYTGGGTFTNANDVDSGIIQELSLKDRFLFHRSTFTVFEQLQYLPESSLGFAGAAGAGIPGVGGGVGVGTGYTPGQSLLVPRGQNLSSSTAGEWDYQVSPRTSITLVGSYSLLHYFDNDLANYGNAGFQAGFNYRISRLDTVAISYQFSAIRYSNLGQSINTNTVQGVYSRRITGKLGLQISAGPQFVTSNTPITSTGSTTPTATSYSSLYWTLNANATYAFRRATLVASYSHGLTGGSGLLVGAETDIVTGTLSGRISRATNAGVSFGYARNNGLGVGTTADYLTYDYWFAGANWTRTMGRSLDVFANYQFQHQNNSTTGCTGTACGQGILRSEITVGVNIHKQPIPF